MRAWMVCRVCAVTVIAAVSALPAAAGSRQLSPLENLPYSGGVLMARALRQGRVVLPSAPTHSRRPASSAAPASTCMTGYCVLPNVDASSGSNTAANETPIIANPANANELLSGANDYGCANLQGFYVSTDQGATWTHACLGLAAGYSFGDGDPIVAFDTNGVAYAGGIDENSSATSYVDVVSTSTDHGKTWSTPVIAVPALLGFMADKPWMQIDTGANSPRKNTIYISATQFDSNNGTEISVSTSTDGGQTWTTVPVSPRASFPTIQQFSDLAIDQHGNVYLTWMHCTAGGAAGDCGDTVAQMLISISTDGGQTWSQPVLIEDVNMVPDTCGAFYGCLPNTAERVSNIPAVAIDDSRGKLYVVDDTWTGKKMQVQVTASLDGSGTWWGRPVPVSPLTGGDQFFPWISANGSGPFGGLVGVTWLDRRLDPRDVNYDAFGTIFADGVNFTSQRLSSVSSNPNNDGFGGGFMGDYTGNAWSGTTLFQSWADTRNGSYAQDEVGGIGLASGLP